MSAAPAGDAPGHGEKRISPTDISQFIRLEQCERYLRLRLDERAGRRNRLREYGVQPQSIPPLLTRSGRRFEEHIEAAAAQRFRCERFVRTDPREYDNDRVVDLARRLPSGETVILLQPRLEVEVDGWWMRGDLDLLRLERTADGTLEALIADMKSSTSAKVEHRLQVAFYQEMLTRLLGGASIPLGAVATAVLYRGPDDDEALLSPQDAERREHERAGAERLFGTRDAFLEIVADERAYLDSVRDLVLAPDSRASRIAEGRFEDVPYHLTYRCDGCLYNEYCMKWAAEHDDLSLLPHLAANEKSGLQAAGVRTMRDLAALKQFREPDPAHFAAAPLTELVPSPDRAEQARRLATTWPIGPRLDELVHRARRYRKWRKDEVAALSFIPSKGYGSLPYSDAGHNPNLVRVYMDAQHDYLQDRIYLLGALVVANEGGVERPNGRRSIVHLSDGPPDTAEKERALFLAWIRDTLAAIGEVAAPDEHGERRAPIHLVFYNSFDQRLILDGLARHGVAVLGATPLYDFMTQLAAFDSPITTFLDREIQELKNYPMVCQSLQAVAAFLGFDWRTPEPFRDLFRTRMFDFWGKLEQADDSPSWYASRSRFNSQIPLEYAYAAWGDLESEPEGQRRKVKGERTSSTDTFPFPPSPFPSEEYGGATTQLLAAFHARRLEAIEAVAADFQGNRLTLKSSFDLSALGQWTELAPSLATALDEFVTIERLVELANWKAARLAPPERRVLSGETFVVRFEKRDQDPAHLAAYEETERRRRLRERQDEEYRAANPDAKRVARTKEQQAETKWSQEGQVFRLRFVTDGVGADLREVLALSTLRVGDRVIVCPRTTTDSRLPEADRVEFTPTPKQMLYGMRADITSIDPLGGFVEVRLAGPNNAKDERGFVFSSRYLPLVEGERYTLDKDPNDWNGQFASRVTEGLVAGRPNTLYARLAHPQESHVSWPPEAARGQERFRDGLAALHAAGTLHPFEESKRRYIGECGDQPTLLVQGPPGTGKSYTTAWAVFARIQGAMAAGIPYRVFLTCKTHAATRVLLDAVAEAQADLARYRLSQPAIFARYFDRALLDVPLYRARPKADEQLPSGTVVLPKDDDREPGQQRAADRIEGQAYCIVAATPAATRGIVKDRWPKELFGHDLCECLVLDEASQMNLPEACMAALPLKPDGHLVVVGDHRQMPPIVKHDWIAEPRRTFQRYRSYESLFLSLREIVSSAALIKFEQSFRLHADMAAFLRQEIYRHDGIPYYSEKRGVLPSYAGADRDPFVAAVLAPEHPLVVVLHDEHGSQLSNPFERDLMRPVLQALGYPPYDLGPEAGMGVVVPHRAQRAAFQEIDALVRRHGQTGAVTLSAADTVERFQGGEREVIVVSATESDPQYLLASGQFLLEPRRLTVALSRAKRKMILVASRSVFGLFSADEETFADAQLWKNLLRRTCTDQLWTGEVRGQRVEVWGNPPSSFPP